MVPLPIGKFGCHLTLRMYYPSRHPLTTGLRLVSVKLLILAAGQRRPAHMNVANYVASYGINYTRAFGKQS